VGAFVGLEVGALSVDLLAAVEIAFVHFTPTEAVGKITEGSGGWREDGRRRVAWRGVAVRTEAVAVG